MPTEPTATAYALARAYGVGEDAIRRAVHRGTVPCLAHHGRGRGRGMEIPIAAVEAAIARGEIRSRCKALPPRGQWIFVPSASTTADNA